MHRAANLIFSIWHTPETLFLCVFGFLGQGFIFDGFRNARRNTFGGSIIELCHHFPQFGEAILFVEKLAAPLLRSDHEARRDVSEPHRAVGHIHMLPPLPVAR